MAMTPTLWSISGLAVELEMDRRTVAAKLRDVPPDGQLRGHPAWRLQTALLALRGDAKRPEPAPPPAGAAVLARIPSTTHAALVCGALEACYAVPWFARAAAIQCGVEPEQAGQAALLAMTGLKAHFERLFREMAIAAFEGSDPTWVELGSIWWLPSRGLREDLELPGGKRDLEPS